MAKQVKTLSDLKDSQLLYEKKLPAFGYMIVLLVVILLVATVIWSYVTPRVFIVQGSGFVVSENRAYIMSAFSGEVSYVYVRNGDFVEEGDLLFAIRSADFDLQRIQIDGGIEILLRKKEQQQRLENSIQNNVNKFDFNNPEDRVYYSQFELFKSRLTQNVLDIGTLEEHGMTDAQISIEIARYNAYIAEIYHSTLRGISESIRDINAEIESLELQIDVIIEGQSDYIITANVSGNVHMPINYRAGMVIQTGQMLGSIAQPDDNYFIEAFIHAVDMPRIERGNRVDIAVPGLLESLYGTVGGIVTHIDSDITRNNEGNINESFFRIYIQPDFWFLISNSGRMFNLSNGTMVETRIQYAEVTYFEYFLEFIGALVR
jgi:multidrug resistance efflux pump